MQKDFKHKMIAIDHCMESANRKYGGYGSPAILLSSISSFQSAHLEKDVTLNIFNQLIKIASNYLGSTFVIFKVYIIFSFVSIFSHF